MRTEPLLGSAPRIARKRPADQAGMGGGYASRWGAVDDPVPWRTMHSLKLKMPFLGYPLPIIFRGGGLSESTDTKKLAIFARELDDLNHNFM